VADLLADKLDDHANSCTKNDEQITLSLETKIKDLNATTECLDDQYDRVV